MSDVTVADRFYDALARGDAGAVRACFAPDAVVWHAFDGVAQDVATAMAALEGVIAHSRERRCDDVRQEPIAGGLLRRHVFVLELANGERKAWPVCLVYRIEDGLIARADEYIDRAGSFAPGDGPVGTPGF